jgi:hypothetical protein
MVLLKNWQNLQQKTTQQANNKQMVKWFFKNGSLLVKRKSNSLLSLF